MNVEALDLQRDRLLARLDAIAAKCGENFPLHAAEPGQPWRVSEGGGGFWAACHWMRAALAGSATDQAKATALCHRLAAKLHAPAGHRAFLFWYGAALGERWCGDAGAAQLARAAAQALSNAWTDEIHAIPLGTALGGGPGGDARISIDALAPTLLLLHHHGDDVARGKARRHADTLLRAAVIAARAFVTMARQDACWIGEARRVVEAVLASPWLVTSVTHGMRCDRFVGCCLASPGSVPMLAETAWGTYLLIELLHELAAATGIVAGSRVPAVQFETVAADCGGVFEDPTSRPSFAAPSASSKTQGA